MRGPGGSKSGALKRVSIFFMHCPLLSPLGAHLFLQASSAGVAMAAFSLTLSSPHPSFQSVVQSPSINPFAGIRGLSGNNVWSLDWPRDSGGLVPKLGTRIKLKRKSTKRLGGAAISQYNAGRKMHRILKQTELAST